MMRTTTTTVDDAATAAVTGGPDSFAAYPAPLQESGSAPNQDMDGVMTTGPMGATGGTTYWRWRMGSPQHIYTDLRTRTTTLLPRRRAAAAVNAATVDARKDSAAPRHA